MRQSIAILSTIASTAFAQASSVAFFFPGGYEGIGPVASVVQANPSTTVLDLACPTGTDSTECGFGFSGFRYSIISTTIYQASMSQEDFDLSFTCNHNVKAAQVTCGVSVAGVDGNPPEITTSVLSGSDIAFITASVTAGGELLAAAQTGAAGTSSGPAKTTDSSAPTASSTASVASSTGFTTSGTATTTLASGVSTPQPTYTGAAYKYGVEGPALLALAGAAAVGMW